MAGERVVDPALAAAALAEGDIPLTPREHEVLAAARRRRDRGRARGRLHLSAGDGAQLPVVGDPEAGAAHPGGGRERGGGQGLAVGWRLFFTEEVDARSR